MNTADASTGGTGSSDASSGGGSGGTGGQDGSIGATGGSSSDGSLQDSASTGGSTADGAVTCGPISCQTAATDAGGTYDTHCQTTCSNGAAPSCTCTDDYAYACFCDLGKANPGCLTGSLTACGYVPTCSANLMADPQNCGRCGHSCQGLSCVGGLCESPNLSFGVPYSPSDWTSDGTYIYASDCGGAQQVIRVPVDGVPSGGSPLIYTSGNGPWGIAIDSTSVYWLEDLNGTVWSAPIGGGAPTQLGSYGVTWTSGSICGGIHSLAIDATNLYWSVQPNSGNGYVFSIPKTGGAVHILAHDCDILRGTIGLDANNVYFMADDAPQGQQHGILRSVPKSGGGDAGTSTVVAQFNQQESQDFRVVGSQIFVNGVVNGIFNVPIGGGPMTLFWSAQHPGLANNFIDSDGTTLFFTDTVYGNVYAMPVAGGYPDRIAVNMLEPNFILVDQNAVYWTSIYGGFYRVPKSYRP